MPRRPKQGIEFAGWSVDIFDGDTKVDKLLDAQGWVGFGIYFFLCQMAYKFDGYFYRWAYDDSASTARRMGGGIGSGTVEETVRYCLQIGLFDKGLFDKWNILTSKGIQRRFLAAIQGRRVKTVIADYWLLDNSESEGLDKCVTNDDLQPTNADLQGANSDLQPTNIPKSKVKESRVEESNITVPSGTVCRTEDVRRVVEAWNSLGLQTIKKIVPDSERWKMLRKRIADYGIEDVLEAIENVRKSHFLMGGGKKGWQATFDWFIRPNNFPKVLSGNYNAEGKPFDYDYGDRRYSL